MNMPTWLQHLLGRDTKQQGPSTDFHAALAAQDYDAALAILKAECKRDNAEAMTVLATLYSMGCGVEQNDAEAALWYRQGAVRGNRDAQAMLGSYLAAGRGTSCNPQESAYWLFQSARAGHQVALDWLADLVLQVPDVVGEHFGWKDVTDMLKARGRNMMFGHIHPGPSALT